MNFSDFQIGNYLFLFFVFALVEILIRLLPHMQKSLEDAPRDSKPDERKD